MPKVRGMVAMLSVLGICSMVGVAVAKTLSREDVDTIWEDLLRQERYEAIQYSVRPSTPTPVSLTDEKKIVVTEGRGRLWGDFFGISGGGGWDIRGQLEAEILLNKRILQLYSKETWKMFPGFAFIWMPWYDPNKYPFWEFRLILRDALNRQRVQPLTSIFLSPGDIVPTFDATGRHSIKELVGQRIPRGELRYDKPRHVAVMQILGVREPRTAEVSLSPYFPPVQE